MGKENIIEKLEEIPGFVTDDEEINNMLDAQEQEEETKNEGNDKGNDNDQEPEQKPKKKSNDNEDKSKEEIEAEKEEDEARRINEELDNEEFSDDDDDNNESDDKPKKKEKKSKADKKSNKNDDDGNDEPSYLNIIETMRKRKIIEYDDPDEGEEPYTDEEAQEILEDAIEEKVSEQLKDLINDLDPIAKSIIKYAADGGDTNEFIKKFLSSGDKLPDKIDLTKVENQKAVIRESLKGLDYDDETIDAQIEFFEDSGQLEKRAKAMYDKIVEKKKKAQEKELQEQEERKQQYIEKLKQQRRDFDKYVQDTDEVGVMKLTRQDKRELTSYLMDRNVKTKNQGNITSFHADLGDVLQNRDASIQLAKLLRMRDKNGMFKFDDIIRDTETKVTSRVRDSLRRKPSSVPKGRYPSNNQKKSLVDWLDE